MKKTSIILVISIISSLFMSLTSMAETVYEDIKNSYITKGVTSTHIERLTSSGWININYITVDFNEKGLGLKVLSNDDIKNKSTVLNMAKENEDVVCAINGDFFTTYSSTSASEGMMIKDGVLYTTPSNDSSYATFFVDDNFNMLMDYFTFDIMVTSKRTNDSSKILFFNKNADPMYLKLYDSNFGEKSPGSMNDGYEVVVEDNIVTEVLSNKEGVTIPKNGYVLHNSLRHSLFLMQNFNVGDEVELLFTLSPDIKNIKEAIGGGTILLKEGEIFDFTLKDGTQPMTALGVDKEGKKLILFTVDGRQTHSRGMSFKEIAAFLKELGCYNAMSFDGGGSTTMVASSNGNELAPINLLTYQREVINALGVTYKRKQGNFLGMEISVSKDNVFPNQPVEINIESSYDEYGNHFPLDTKNVKFTADKKGEFKGNVFFPEKPGKVNISATYKNVTKTKTVNVYNEPTRLKASVSSFDITDKLQKVSFYLANDDGFSSYIPSSELTFLFDDVKGYIENDNLVLTKLVEGDIVAKYKDLSLTIPVGKKALEPVKDKFERTTDKNGYVFSVFGINNHGTTLFSNYITGKRNLIANKCDLSAFKVVPEDVTTPAVRVSNYGREDEEHSLFIKLDNSKGSITSTKPEQWDWLLNVFKKGVGQKNVFINMPLDISKYSDEKELNILTNLLKENLADKNIFIITYGNDNTYSVVDGIRYITVCDIPKFSYENPFEVINKLKYAQFKIVDDEVYFSFEPLF